MPLVKDEKNPIDIPKPKVKRQMSEAQSENSKKARKAKAAKKNQVTIEIKPKTDGKKVLESKLKNLKK